MRIVAERPGVTVEELAQALGVGMKRVWQIIERLEFADRLGATVSRPSDPDCRARSAPARELASVSGARACPARLRVLLALHKGADSLGTAGCEEAFRVGLGPTAPADLDLIAAATDEDRQLGLACFAIEAELRRRGWAALEWLGAILPEPNINAALDGMSRDQLVELVRAVRELGWIGPAPVESDE